MGIFRHRATQLLPQLLLTLALGCGIPTGNCLAANFANRPVADVLRELQNSGLVFIYNDQQVPASLKVLTEPGAQTGVALAREILAPHALTVRQIAPNTWSIVAIPTGERAGPPARARGSERTDEIIVTASRYQLATADGASHSFLTQAELRSLPKLADEPLRAVHRLPGAASNGLSGFAHIRGGEEDETEFVLDGMTLQEPFHLKSLFSPVSIVPAEAIGGLDAYSGGFPVRYGNRMSGVIDARSIDPPQDGERQLGLSLFHTAGLAGDEFADGRGRWLASGRRSNLAQVLKLANSDLGEPRYVDAFAKAELDLSDATTVALHALFAEDRLDVNDSDKVETARVTDRGAYAWFSVERRFNDDATGRALLSYTSVDNDRRGAANDPGKRVGSVVDSRDFRSFAGRVELERGDADRSLLLGVEASRLTSSYDYQSALVAAAGFPFPLSPATTVNRAFDLAPDGWSGSAYANYRRRLAEDITGEFGLRWDSQTYDRIDGGTQLSPRIALLWDIGDSTQLRASWGRFFQAQGINELQVEDGVDRYSAAQRADHSIIGLQHEFAAAVTLRVEAYYKDYEELKPRFENLFDPLVLLPELQTDRVRVAPRAGDVRGIEILLRDRSDSALGWWFGYTWSRVEETLDGRPVSRGWDQRHTVNGGIDWTRGPWDLSLAGTWHTGWPTTTVTLAETPPGLPPEVIIGSRNADRFRDFWSVDGRISRTFQLADSEILGYFEVTNLLGRKNPCCSGYSVVDNGGTFELRRDEDIWPRLVPNLGVLWRF